MTVRSFQIRVADDVLSDLRSRLIRTRFTEASDTEFWAAGTDPGYLRDLVAYWADGFDWRAAERALNAYPHYLAEVGGRWVHFVHLRGQVAAGAPAPLPLIMTHGWPSSFVEMLQAATLLADPAGRGGDPAVAFDVVVPSLPGFLYSELPQGPPSRPESAGIAVIGGACLRADQFDCGEVGTVAGGVARQKPVSANGGVCADVEVR